MEVTCTIEHDLTDALGEEIRRLQQMAFGATDEFAAQRWWHTPLSDDEKWFTVRQDGKLIASARLLFRIISTPDGDVLVGGVGNVCSHSDYRGCGAAKACLRAAAEMIQREADFGLLFCGEAVREFYERLGWQVVDNLVRYCYGGEEMTKSPYTMVHAGRQAMKDWPAGEINLNGPDW